MITTHVDIDPDGDVRAILSEPIGSFAPTITVGEPQVSDADGNSNLPSADRSYLTSTVNDGKYKPYRIIYKSLY